MYARDVNVYTYVYTYEMLDISLIFQFLYSCPKDGVASRASPLDTKVRITFNLALSANRATSEGAEIGSPIVCYCAICTGNP